jgi:hypothetical protein
LNLFSIKWIEKNIFPELFSFSPRNNKNKNKNKNLFVLVNPKYNSNLHYDVFNDFYLIPTPLNLNNREF